MVHRVESFDHDGESKAQPIFTLADASVNEVRQARAAAGDGQGVSDHPQTRQEQLQEFVDGFGKVGYLYSNSVPDKDRLGAFQDRMGGVYQFDHQTFKELSHLTDRMTSSVPASPQEIGKALADVFADTMNRHGGESAIASNDMLNTERALAGYMLAARSTFDQAKIPAQTTEMVEAMEKELKSRNINTFHAIIWGDTKEPGVAVVPRGKSIDRLNYSDQ